MPPRKIEFKVTITEGVSRGQDGWYVWMGSEGAEKHFCTTQMDVYLWFQRLWELFCAMKEALKR